MSRTKLLVVVATAIVAANVVASGIPLSLLVPPLYTVALLVAVPLVVGVAAALVRHDVAPIPADQRRAEAAHAPRSRRREASESSTPSPDRVGFKPSPTPFELSDRFAT